ncbi:5-methylcytosine-specific restriction endonuclease system specificity protein McrC [soil metagenome]
MPEQAESSSDVNIPVQNIYYLLCYAWNKLDEKDRVAVSVEDSTTLVDLFAKILATATTSLLKRGIDREYITHTEEIPGLRGKLDVGTTLKRNTLQKGRTVCSFDELSANTLLNRILVSTISNLTRTEGLDEDLRKQLHHLRGMLFNVSNINITSSLFGQVRIHRNNRIYGFIMDVCEIIHQSLLPTESAGHYSFVDFTKDDRKMHQLFEKFVRNFYHVEQSTYTSRSRVLTWNFTEISEGASQYLPRMSTDISLQSNHRDIIIDTKYYSNTLQSNYETDKIHSSHLYQLTGYLIHQQDAEERPHTMQTTGILLYPTVQQELDLCYSFEGHPVHIRTVNLNATWKTIHNRLLGILNDAV